MPGSNSMMQRAVLASREAVPYVGEALVPADGVRDLRSFGFAEPDPKRLDNKNAVKRTFGPSPAAYDTGAATIALSLGIPVRAPTANGSLPQDIAEFLVAAGMAETVNVGASVVYSAPTPDDIALAPTASLAVYEAGMVYDMIGTRGNFTIEGKPGQQVILNTQCRAPFVLPSVDTAVPVVSAPVGVPLVFSGGLAITEDGSAIDIGSFSFTLGNELADEVTNTGVKVLVPNRTPMLRIDPLAVATTSEWQKLISGGTVAFVADFNGMKLEITKAQLVENRAQDRNQRIANAQAWETTETAGDDHFTLTFTAPA